MSQIQSTTFTLPTAPISNGTITGNPWSNPNNLLLVDGEVSQSNPNNSASDVIIGNYNLRRPDGQYGMPQDAVIVGIEMELIAKRGATVSPPITITPYFVDNTSGEDVYYPYVTPFSGLTPDLDTYVLGGQNYLFATEFTPDQINNMKMALVANGDVYVDSLLVKVYYYIPDPVEPPTPVGDSCEDCDSPIQAQPFYLALPFLANETKAYLKSFNYPDGLPIQYEDLGACGGAINLVFDEGKPKVQGSNFEENAKVAIWTYLPNGTVELDFVTLENRGLAFKTPYEHDADLLSDHDANSKVIISNNAPYEGQKLRLCQRGSIFSGPISVEDEEIEVAAAVEIFNFKGGGVIASVDPSDPNKVNVTIAGAGGTTPPQRDTVESATSGDEQVSSLTWDHACSGVNRLLVVEISSEQSKTITGVTYGGTPFTQKVSNTNVGGNIRSEIWTLIAPPAGNSEIEVTFSAPSYCCAGSESFVGVDQTTPTGDTSVGNNTSNAPTVTVTTLYDNSIVVDSLVTAQTPILYTIGANQIENWHHTTNSDTRQGGSSVEAAGSIGDNVVMDYSITQSTPWVMTAMEIKGITSSSGGGADIDLEVNQVGHGLTEGSVVRSLGVANQYVRAQADTSSHAEVVGIVKEVIDANNFILSKDAYYSGAAIPSGTPGNGVFLSPTVPGAITTTIPVTPGQVIKPLGVLLASAALMSFSADIRGNTVAGSVPGGVQSVTGLNTNNTDPANPIVRISVDGSTITGLGTPGSPLVAVGGGGSGNDSLLPNMQYLGLAIDGDVGDNDIPDGYVLTDTASSRILFPYSNNGGPRLRIFKNDFGSFYQENDILIDASMLTQSPVTEILEVSWCNDATYIYALVRYRKTGSGSYVAIDVVRFDIDGTNDTATNIYLSSGTSNKDSIVWDENSKGSVVSGSSLYTLWRSSGTTDQLRRYVISGTSYTLGNTYTRTSTNELEDGVTMNFDSVASEFYLIGGHVSGSTTHHEVQKWEIIGGTDFQAMGPADEFNEVFRYSNNAILDDNLDFYVAQINGFQASSCNVYVINRIQCIRFTGSGSDQKDFFQLQGGTYPKI